MLLLDLWQLRLGRWLAMRALARIERRLGVARTYAAPKNDQGAR